MLFIFSLILGLLFPSLYFAYRSPLDHPLVSAFYNAVSLVDFGKNSHLFIENKDLHDILEKDVFQLWSSLSLASVDNGFMEIKNYYVEDGSLKVFDEDEECFHDMEPGVDDVFSWKYTLAVMKDYNQSLFAPETYWPLERERNLTLLLIDLETEYFEQTESHNTNNTPLKVKPYHVIDTFKQLVQKFKEKMKENAIAAARYIIKDFSKELNENLANEPIKGNNDKTLQILELKITHLESYVGYLRKYNLELEKLRHKINRYFTAMLEKPFNSTSSIEERVQYRKQIYPVIQGLYEDVHSMKSRLVRYETHQNDNERKPACRI